MVDIESERIRIILANIEYEIIEEIGVLSENARGWRKELNKVSWNGPVHLNMISATGQKIMRKWEKGLH